MIATAYNTEDSSESILRNTTKGISDAASDASIAAKAAAQNVKDGVGRGVYNVSFGLSFGVVFTGVFLTELLPARNPLRRGLEDGAGAALVAIDARKPFHEVPTEHLDTDLVPETVAPKPKVIRKRTKVATDRASAS